jgi:hypothetical protein
MDPLTLALIAAGAWFVLRERDAAKPGAVVVPSTGGLPPIMRPAPARPAPPVVVTPIPAAPVPVAPAPTTSKPKAPVPNWSSNPAGYNQARFPDFASVRQHGFQLGYKTAKNRTGAGALAKTPGEAWVRRFQADYNKEPGAPGTLAVDGVPGPQTLNAMEWIHETMARALWWATRHTGTP